MTPATEARRLLRTCRSGALATASERLHGHPFASIVPFMSDYDGSPVMLVSRLAEHTKNIAFDARVSLMVHEPDVNVQATARLTIAGLCKRFDACDALRDRYVRLFPEASELLELDFDFHRITQSAIRYIGGFGKIHWIAPASFTDSAGIDAIIEQQWLSRLNAVDRPDAAHRSSLPPNTDGTHDSITAVALDRDGVDLLTHGRLHRRPFAESADSPRDLYDAMAPLLGRPDS